MNSALLLTLRRLRWPLVLLVGVYAIGITGLVLIPGVDEQGNPAHMGFFHAFYFLSYTASTIGFGEIPEAFTDTQRLWVTAVIYMSVVAWAPESCADCQATLGVWWVDEGSPACAALGAIGAEPGLQRSFSSLFPGPDAEGSYILRAALFPEARCTDPSTALTAPADIASVDLPFPLFAKPVAEGTGKGVSKLSKITSRTQLDKVCRTLLRTYNQPVLVERFLPGREFTVGILGTGRKARVLAVLEIILLPEADAEVYSYRNKENCEELVRYQLLPHGELSHEIESLCLRAWRALGCRDAGRMDVRLDENGEVSFIEVNPLAGIHPEHSDLPIMATLANVSYRELIGQIMKSAMNRVRQPAGRKQEARAA